MSPRRLGSLLLLGLAVGCGRAEEGASVVRGTLLAGSAWEASFDMVAAASASGGGPLRLVITDHPDLDADQAPARRGIAVDLPSVVRGANEVLIAPAEGGAAGVAWSFREGFRVVADAGQEPEVRYPDGSFALRPTSGRLSLHLAGLQPGDAVTGELSLEFTTGERLFATFATALSD